jgi:hypothetical protein
MKKTRVVVLSLLTVLLCGLFSRAHAERRAPPEIGTKIRTKDQKERSERKIETRRFAYGCECGFHP